jgi:hypothetical protein
MKLRWQLDPSDIERTRLFVLQYRDHPAARSRMARELRPDDHAVPLEAFWRALVSSLLGSSQRRGAKHPVTQFLRTRPFPLELPELLGEEDPFPRIQLQLKQAGGLGRSHELADQLAMNLEWLAAEGQSQVTIRLGQLRLEQRRSEHWPFDPRPFDQPPIEKPPLDQPPIEKPWCGATRERELERETADWLDQTLKGFGPRQARHFLQLLGLARFEIPLDAALIRWLNQLGVSPALSAAAISQRGYYLLVQDGVRQLCAASHVWPCQLHAMVLAAGGIDDEATCW